MKNNSESNEFIERLKVATENNATFKYDENKHPWGVEIKAARILHEIATNPDIKVVYDEDGRVIDALEHEIKCVRAKAALIEKRNPDGSLDEIIKDMKVTALKLETRVLEHLKSIHALDDLIGGV